MHICDCNQSELYSHTMETNTTINFTVDCSNTIVLDAILCNHPCNFSCTFTLLQIQISFKTKKVYYFVSEQQQLIE